MKRFFLALTALSAVVFSSCKDDDDDITTPPPILTRPNVPFTGLTADGRIIAYNAQSTETPGAALTITGLQAGESVQAIDYRPGTGQLYGITNQSRIYIINTTSGAATVVGVPFATPISGTVTGFDFNPTVDRIRVISSSGQNLRVNPETGLVTTDTPLPAGTGMFGGVAYTNNFAGSIATELFAIDITNRILLKSSNPNGGLYSVFGSGLGQSPTAGGELDIAPDNSFALATFTFGATNSLYAISLTSGAATYISNIATPVIGIAISTIPVAYAAQGSNLLILNPTSTSIVPITKPFAPLAAGESIVGIDIRPATGGLYALGSTGQLYSVNTSTGALTVVGAPIAISGTTFGFDFNPTVDRLRIVSNTGQNLRVNPNDGVVTTDAPLSPLSPQVSAVAYTNNFQGATTTALFYVDHNTDILYTSAAPNAGVLTAVGPIGVNIDAANGFDISGSNGKAYGIFTSGSSTNLYSVNLSTGAVTSTSAFVGAVNGFTVGYGF